MMHSTSCKIFAVLGIEKVLYEIDKILTILFKITINILPIQEKNS